jgi:hypothetical protein
MPRRDGEQRDRVRRILAHLFQHQIHHRGQAHAMLAGTGVKAAAARRVLLHGRAELRAGDFAELGFTEGRDLGRAGHRAMKKLAQTPISILDLVTYPKVEHRRRVPQLAPPRPGRRGVGIPALLGRGAPQPRRHRERRDGGAHRLPRRGNEDDPRGLGGIMLPEPRALHRGRAGRHAGVDLSRAHRPGPGPRARAPIRSPCARCGGTRPAPDFDREVAELVSYFARCRRARR